MGSRRVLSGLLVVIGVVEERLVHHLAVAALVVPLPEVRELEPPHLLNCRIEGLAGASTSSLAAARALQRSKCSQNPRPVESLAAAVLAEAHDSIMPHPAVSLLTLTRRRCFDLAIELDPSNARAFTKRGALRVADACGAPSSYA